MRISDWSSDVCSSDLSTGGRKRKAGGWPAAKPPSGASGRNWNNDMGPKGADWKKPAIRPPGAMNARSRRGRAERKSVVEGKRVSVRVDLGGRRIIKKKKHGQDIENT